MVGELFETFMVLIRNDLLAHLPTQFSGISSSEIPFKNIFVFLSIFHVMHTLNSCINLSISTQLKPFISSISSTQHMDIFGPFYTTRTVFTVPKQSKWVVHGQPTHPTSVPIFETDFHGYSRSHTYQHTI